ncbi:P-loop containing nucleoside triphosphate hydrolase protein [Phlyctochytrium arcticum]|nr:P-loop containing nucleoside triphosphate hydrolase protein [Phlyctochytrium arcticum]
MTVAAVSAGGGAAAYVGYKMDEFQKEYIPDWMKGALSKMTDAVNNMDLSNFDLPKFDLPNIQLPDFPDFNVDLSKFSLPDILPDTPPVFKGMEAAAEKFDAMSAAALSRADERVGSSTAAKDVPVAANIVQHNSVPTKSSMTPPDQDLMVLTKKLIEIRNLLKTVDNNASMTLPSIVVIGSQSSGKSSVLEAIVGHEFLPKGNNMVTRRPIELTLVHTPGSTEDYAEFPQLGLGKVKDFSNVQKTLKDLNLAVSDAECVSNKPIELRIYSPNVPDLSLVDLPGFIQINNRDQPEILKEKITELCESYIREPNIILAVCAADVDLANSEALRASRKVDPRGRRTIGVITKMDLVDQDNGVGILTNKNYPLQLGYIGVVCGKSGGGVMSNALIRSEDAFFKSHPAYRSNDVMVGTGTLRRRLMEVLETYMGKSLNSISDAVQTELEEARYQFKVHYNDRKISAESYVAESIDTLKQRFKEFAKGFGKPQVREEVRAMLEQRLLDICRDMYWTDPRIANLPKLCLTDPYWAARLDIGSGALTKSGVGRSSVQLVVDVLMRNMERLTSTDPWMYHDDGRKRVLEFSNDLLRAKFNTAVDQVENTIKPYKFEVECTELEWQEGQKRAVHMLETQLKDSQGNLQGIMSSVGRRKLKQAVKYVQKVDREEEIRRQQQPQHSSPKGNDKNSETQPDLADSNPGFNVKLVERARDALTLQTHIAQLSARLSATKSRQCSTAENKACCPEVYLSVVAEKLTYTAVMFIWVELLNEFFFQLPREIDNQLYHDLTKREIRQFAAENPVVQRHLEVQDKKATLEIVMEKLRDLQKKKQ